MRRRDALLGLTGVLAAWPAAAQQRGKVAHIGVLSDSWWSPMDGLRIGLQEFGYVEGGNLRLDYRWAEGNLDSYPTLVADLIESGVDLIWTTGTAAAVAAHKATSTIPIVMGNIGDPVGIGLVASLHHPGGNVTGLSSLSGDLEQKRVEILKDLRPDLARITALSGPLNPYVVLAAKNARRAAEILGLEFNHVVASTEGGIEDGIRALGQLKPEAVIVLADLALLRHRARIIEYMNESRTPAVYGIRLYVDDGGLISYASDHFGMYRRSARLIDKILRGTKPADIPVEQEWRFETVVNLKAAAAIGLPLPLPPLIMVRATEIIE